jgi:hypothetical protein
VHKFSDGMFKFLKFKLQLQEIFNDENLGPMESLRDFREGNKI